MNMKRFSELTPVEQTLLLGFLPLLGATANLGTALVAALVGVITTLCVLLASRIATERFGETARWTVLVATGIGVSYFLTTAAGFFVPISSGATLYLYLIGLTPLVYIGVRRPAVPSIIVPTLVRFFILAVSIGTIREVFGSAALLGMRLPMFDGQAPIGILSSPAGALLVFASVAFLSGLVRSRVTKPSVVETEEGA